MPFTLDELYTEIIDMHRQVYGGGGNVLIARAPGRVNVIGEHTDYNGLPVLPIALDREIAIAFSESGSQDVLLTNIDARFGERRFIPSGAIEPYPAGDWGNYAKAAAQAIWGWAEIKCPDKLPLKGYCGCVGGTIPPGSGLSSSSAMVVAAALALLSANGIEIDPVELADLMARAERYVGTEGGGMDQAASILSKPGCALKIDFNPFKTEVVPLAGDCMFIIANSLVVADKAGSARLAYNTRVVECRLGVQLFKAFARGSHPQVEDAVSLGDVMRIVPDWKSLIEDLPEGGVSLATVSDVIGLPESELRERCLRLRDGSIFKERPEGFAVKRRCRHVLTEAERVELAVSAMREGRLGDLGRHMNDSHESCAQDYEVSCPELDVLVHTMRRNGALGARLTGAGFGGCAVAAVLSGDAQELLQGVRSDYYTDPNVDTDSAAFTCVASGGAGVLRVGGD